MNKIIKKDEFLKHVEKHHMEIKLDNGLYRHIQFKEPGTFNQYFNLITFPGGLLIRGDMGTFEFERIPDMFDFFRTKELGINIGYWAEKCQAEYRNGGMRQFRSAQVKKNIIESWKDYFEIDELPEDEDPSCEAQDVMQTLKEEVFDLCDEDSEWQWVSALYNLRFEGIDTHFGGYDLLSECMSNAYEPTYHFVWCLWAITWGIQQYDEVMACCSIEAES